MKRRFLRLAAAIVVTALLLGAAAVAQNSSGSDVPRPSSRPSNAAPADKPSGNANAGIGEILAQYYGERRSHRGKVGTVRWG